MHPRLPSLFALRDRPLSPAAGQQSSQANEDRATKHDTQTTQARQTKQTRGNQPAKQTDRNPARQQASKQPDGQPTSQTGQRRQVAGEHPREPMN
jgi:hypothetical protein